MSSNRRRAAILVVLLMALPACTLFGCHRPLAHVDDRTLIGEVMMHSELAENLRAICLDGGRLSGSENALTAERYVADKLREYGLRNVHLEEFDMPGWQVNKTVVTVLTDPPMTCENAVALFNTRSTPPAGITAEVVDVGKGSEEEYTAAGDALRGKFALIHETGGRRTDWMDRALERGAAGMIVIGRENHEPIIGTCHKSPHDEPGVIIRHPDGEQIAGRIAAGEAVRVCVQVEADIWDAKPHNVVGDIPGTGPHADEVVLIGAHLDSWHLAEGAIDNGNGSACILETARALTAVDWAPRRTVRFVWFMGEEQGLFGSKAYVAAHESELSDIVAMVNVDMPGSPRTLGTSSEEMLTPFLRKLRDDLKAYEIGEEVRTYKGGFSDHAPFMEAGVPTAAVWGEIGPGVENYHTNGDKYDCVDRRATVESSAVLAVLMRRLADEYQL